MHLIGARAYRLAVFCLNLLLSCGQPQQVSYRTRKARPEFLCPAVCKGGAFDDGLVQMVHGMRLGNTSLMKHPFRQRNWFLLIHCPLSPMVTPIPAVMVTLPAIVVTARRTTNNFAKQRVLPLLVFHVMSFVSCNIYDMGSWVLAQDWVDIPQPKSHIGLQAI